MTLAAECCDDRDLARLAAAGVTLAAGHTAAYLGLEGELGHIAPGYRADLTLLGAELGVLATWVGGDEQWYGDTSDAAAGRGARTP